jgi:hypothetical protein
MHVERPLPAHTWRLGRAADPTIRRTADTER